MQTNIDVRQNMLNVLVTAILAGSKKINFYDEDDNLLCEVLFTTIESGTVGAIVSYKFQDGESLILRSVVTSTGEVSYFTIDGIPDAILVDDVLRGTVGTLSSSHDIKFNNLMWSQGMNLTLTNLSIIMLQGA